MKNTTEFRLLVKIATLYYDESMNQSDIAKILNLSQSFVSRAIKRCHSEGLVKVSIVHPTGTFIALEQSLQKKYAISQFIIVDVDDGASSQSLRRAIGSGAATYLQNTLTGKELVGISSWSTFISAMIDALHPRTTKAEGVIQILGGVGLNRNLQANILTNEIAKTLCCSAQFLPATSEVQSLEQKLEKLRDPEIAAVVSQFESVDLAIVGIGTSSHSDLIRNLGIVYKEETVRMLEQNGAVGDICMHYYNDKGQAILNDEEDSIISMSLEQLRKCPRVLALAGGIEKIEALKGAMLGGYIDILVTDRITALELAK